MLRETTVNIIHALTHDFVANARSTDSVLDWLQTIETQLPFARFALARVMTDGSVPKDKFTSVQGFPVYDPRILSNIQKSKQPEIDPMSRVLGIPCLNGVSVVGILLAKHKTDGEFSIRENILVEIASAEIAKLLSPTDPGLTTAALAAKARKNIPNIIGANDRLKQILNMIDRVAPTSATVLILGESGTGKELIARRIHALSERCDKAFVAINCGALQETLLESELFGHEKGSFTGAVGTKKGLVEAAEGGTLFLDEVGEMTPALQAKLLRFLQEGEMYRVGGKDPIKVDVRILSATNRDLEEEVKNEKFREDLYYRLNTIAIRSPALRDRKDDLHVLMNAFSPGIVQRLTTDTDKLIREYRWPGNIRELQNTVERVKIMSGDGPILPEHLPLSIRNSKVDTGAPDLQIPIEMSLEDLERHHILRCLAHNDGNKTRAANSLGITLKTLYNKLHRYGIFDRNEGSSGQAS